MQILQNEIKMNIKSTLIWSFSMGICLFGTMALYPLISYSDSSVLNIMPKVIVDIFGLNKANMNEILSYYALESSILAVLFGSVYAALQGGRILAREFYEGTADFLYSKPISRNMIIVYKWCGMALLILIFNVITSAVTIAALEVFKDGAYDFVLLISILATIFLVQIEIASITMLIGLFTKDKTAINSASVGVVILFFFMSISADWTSGLSFLRYVTPLAYADGGDIIRRGGILLQHLIAMTAVCASSLTAMIIIINKRDIQQI